MTRPDRLSRTLQRLDDLLAQEGPPPRPPVPGTAVPDPVAAVEAALAVARSVADGGPYQRIAADDARAWSAAQSATADPRPLAGVTLAVKDLMAVAGAPLGAGSAQRADAAPEDRDAAVLAALRGQGAIVIGQTALHEFAYGVTGINDHTGTPQHPLDPTRVPGGSSSGSAVAVAVGAARLGLGTDTGGSVRIPAALCGIVGFKPSHGEYPTSGVHPLAPSLDHVGLLGRDVVDVRRAHAALGHDPGVQQLPARLGIVDAELAAADDPVRAAVRRALDVLSDAGVHMVSVPWPTAEESFATSTAIMFAEASAVHRRALRDHPERFGDDVRSRLEAGLQVDAPTYVAAKEGQPRLRRRVLDALEGVDAIALPTVPVLAPTVADARDPDVSALLVQATRLLNVVGLPALSVPVPVTGLPVGLQLVGASSARLLGAAAAIEQQLAGVRPH